MGPDKIEKMWAGVHDKIRTDPSYTKVVRKQPPVHKRFNKMKKNNKQRKDRIKQKLASAAKPIAI